MRFFFSRGVQKNTQRSANRRWGVFFFEGCPSVSTGFNFYCFMCGRSAALHRLKPKWSLSAEGIHLFLSLNRVFLLLSWSSIPDDALVQLLAFEGPPPSLLSRPIKMQKTTILYPRLDVLPVQGKNRISDSFVLLNTHRSYTASFPGLREMRFLHFFSP